MSAVLRSVAPNRRGPLVVPQIYDDLRRRIVSVHLAPGAALSESRIAEQYGVSRTPVREAFKKLAEDGFLDVVPQVGSFVARIDLKAVRDNHFVRETLECRLVAVAAERVDADARARLRENVQRQAHAVARDDAQAFFEGDEAMHALIAELAGHANAWHVIHAAKSQLDRVRQLSLADAERSRRRLREHRAIAACIGRGDAAGAEQAMREHLASVFETIRAIAARHANYFVGIDAS